MINDQLSQIFINMGAYCEMSSEKNAFFRARAFKKASEIVSKLPFDLADPEWQDHKKLVALEGIGAKIADLILEFVKTNKINDYEDMKTQSPVNLEELLKVQGIGPKTILKLYNELGITDLESLKKAAEQNLISGLDSFGEKKQTKILESIQFSIKNKDRVTLGQAEREIEQLLAYLKLDSNIKKMEVVGSYRRKTETIGDIDILISSKNPEKTSEYFINYSGVEKILGQGETKNSVWLKSKMQVDIRLLDIDLFGSALQYFTGSKEHNVKLRQIAIERGYKLSEYGLVERDSEKMIESKSEEKIYEKILGHYIDPLLRENSGEIEAAIANKLPKLIEEKDIIGDFHMHTTNSDGAFSIEEMAQACTERGYKVMGISDHFGKLKIANAIDESGFDAYLKAIRTADAKIGTIKILASAEVEIDKEGNLEFDPMMLKQLDYVIASAHFSNGMSKADMTKRLIKAIENPLTSLIAHPRNRLINQRPGYEFDYAEVFKAAADHGVAMEINSHPSRLDLSWELIKESTKHGCKIAINTDAHHIDELANMKYGLDMGKKGWLEAKDLWVPNFSK